MNGSQTAHETIYFQGSMVLPSSVVGENSRRIANIIHDLANKPVQSRLNEKGLEERLFDSRAACKKLVATIAMPMLHLAKEWRDRFFVQLDTLMDADEWDKDDLPITEASFLTFIRMLILLHPQRRPGLGATSDGHIMAVWKKEANRLTIECLPNDQIRWIVFGYFDGKRETAAGENDLTRLLGVLEPYQPEQWLADEGSKTAL